MEKQYVEGLVSVVIPTYNSSKYIIPTIESALKQTYPNLEIVVIDDCSKDDTVQVIEEYAQKDARIRVYRQPENMGAAHARNRGLKEAKGRYIAFLDSDDLWAENKLEKQLDRMRDGEKSFCFCAYDMVDENGTKIKDKIRIRETVRYKDLMTKTMISTPTVVYDRSIIGDPKMPLRRTGQDYAFWLVLLKKCDAVGIDEPLVHVRRRPGSLSKNKFQNIKDLWEVQTINEKISPLKATIHCVLYCFYTVKKRFF